MKMNNRVYGIIGIGCRMANWNADFTGRPKMTGSGDIFGSDKALKYPMKFLWNNQGEKVLYIKSYKLGGKGKEKDKLQPKDLEERYEEIFGAKIDKNTTSQEVLKNLFSSLDVMNFGATFAVKSQNISITGAVQIAQGFNKYKDSRIEVQDILSPFRNPDEKKEDATASSLGTKIMCDEAHYFYHFAVNPENYNNYIGMIPEFEGYTIAAYEKFKDAALMSATAFNTNSKTGCENEFALFIECKEDSKLFLPDLTNYIDFEKNEDKGVVDLTRFSFIEEHMKEIENIEIYYNPHLLKIKSDIDVMKKNIFSKEVIK